MMAVPTKDIIRRVIIWVFFGFVLTLIPLLIVAFMSLPPVANLSGLITAASNEQLLTVAFTLAAAAAADVLISKDKQESSIFKTLFGSVTFILAFFAAMMYIVIRTHAYRIENSQIVPGIQILYAACMICSLICEALSEV